MEDNRYLDIPITTEEYQKKYNERHKLLAEDEIRHARNDNYDPAIGRFKSLRTSVYSSDGSVHAVRPAYGHQRLPSNADDHFPEDPYLRQPTAYTRDLNYNHLDRSPKLWKPVWLRKHVLTLFLLLYLVILLALVLVRHFSRSRNGFDVSRSTSQYAWTYAPTAVLVIIVSLWRQVDYYTKLLAPWDELRKGPVPAARSLLADYVSPFNVVSFFAAFKRGYIPIIATITSFFSLKIMTIFSAALFVQYPTTIISASSTVTSNKAFDASALSQNSFLNSSSFSADPVYATIGNIAYSLPYQPGVSAEYAFVPVDMDRSSSDAFMNSTFTTETDVFFPDLSCQPFQVGIKGSGIARADETTVNETSNQISLRLPDGNGCKRWTSVQIYAMNPQKEVTPPQQIQGLMQRVYCADEGEVGSSVLEPAGLLYTMIDIHYTQVIFNNGTIANSTRTVSNISSILCIPSYYLLTANITNATNILSGDGVTMNVSAVQNRTLDGLSNRTLAVLYDGVMNAAQGIFGARQDDPLALEIPNTTFNLMAMVMNQSSIQPFFDTGTMKKAAQTTFSRVMSNFAVQSLTKAAQNNVGATATYTRNKLHVDNVAFYILLTGSVILIFCTASLLLVLPGPLVPKDPSMIAMSAVVLARSPELNQLLRRQQTLGTAEIRATLSRQEFGTAIATTEQGHNSFKIVVSDAPSGPNPLKNGPSLRWWTPNPLVLPATALAVILSFVLIAVLEVIQSRSDSNGGFETVANDANTNLYMRCIPVLVFLLVAAMMSILDFYVALFAPWNKLDKGNASAKRTLFTQLLGKLPPVAFLEALKLRHFAAVLSIIAGAVASIFAIVSSDLYSVRNVMVAGPSQPMLSQDAFRTQAKYNVLNDYGAAGLVNMIETSKLPYPAGTFDELVLPNYSLGSTHDVSPSALDSVAGPFSATIPALRADLKCDVITPENMDLVFVPKSRNYDTDHWRFNVSYDLPESCHLAGPHRDQSVLHFQSLFNVTNDNTVLYGGKLFDLLFGTNASISSNYGESRAALIGDNPAVGCPSLAFLFAEFETGSLQANGSSLVCYQQIKQLQANVTYFTNSNIVNQRHAPSVNETTAKLLSNPNSTTGVTTFDWRIQHNIERQLYGLGGARLQSNNNAVSYDFDAFFSYIFNNTYQEDPKSLIHSEINITLPIVITHAYRQYMAQAINVGMRQPSTSDTGSIIARQTSTSGPEMLTQLSRPRLVQNRASKLALQILLGIAAFFCILAYALTKFQHVLPHNPCSIAGAMSLLAGSDLCYTLDDALCECCGKPRRSSWDITTDADPNDYHIQTIARNQMITDGAEWMHPTQFEGVFASYAYSMGWWREDRAKMRRRRFGVDIGLRPDGEDEGEWELGDRRSTKDRGFEGFMMRGRDAMADSRGAYRSQRVDESPPPNHVQRTYESPRRVRFEDEV